MNILVLHRIPYHKVEYHRVIDHLTHDVMYVGTKAAIANIPTGLRCEHREVSSKGSFFEELFPRIRKSGRRIERVLALSEFNLEDAAALRQELNVSGARPVEVEIVRNKVKMKAAVSLAGLRIPRYLDGAALTRTSSVPWDGKTILKPIDGACSKDTVVFPTPHAAVAAIEDCMTGIPNFCVDRFQIEEFVEGVVFHIDGFLRRSKPIALVAGRYVGTALEYAFGAPLGSVEIDASPALLDWGADCARAVGIHDGVFHLEAIFGPDGPVFMEIGARAGAAAVVDVVELATGYNLHRVNVALGMGYDLPDALGHVRQHAKYGWFVFPGHRLAPACCSVSGFEPFARDRRILKATVLSRNKPLPTHITYAAEESPIAGVVGGDTTEELISLMGAMFGAITINKVRDR
jgi:hypothetical protein